MESVQACYSIEGINAQQAPLFLVGSHNFSLEKQSPSFPSVRGILASSQSLLETYTKLQITGSGRGATIL